MDRLSFSQRLLRFEQKLPLVSASFWFVLVFGSILWVWGINPRALASPDEALNRFAAQVLSEQGHPFMQLPFADPEDLAHPRHWVSVGDRALPSYAPVTIYFYALLLKLGRLGLLLISALPAGPSRPAWPAPRNCCRKAANGWPSSCRRSRFPRSSG